MRSAMKFARCTIAVALLAAPLQAEPPATEPALAVLDAKLQQRLAEIDGRAGAHRDLVADFVQEKRTPLLQRPLITRGTVHARGDATLWASEKPEPSRMRMDPRTMQIYYPSQRRVEQYPMRAKLGAIATSPLPRLSTLQEQFAIRIDDGPSLVEGKPPADSLQLLLTPRDADARQFVSHVRVLLDAGRGVVRAFEVVDPDGDSTRIRFDDVRTDTDFADGELMLDAPADIAISRPLEAN